MKPRIKICMGSSCFRRGNRKNLEFIETYLEEHDCTADVELVGSRCEENCRKGPNIEINGQMFHGVNQEMLAELLQGLVGKLSGE
ncbi:MAG TPA: (2Fe-2S) ferredoxin domain-containing protein [Geobacteraceae bacterium]|nr:(2Fe-2S) ferredoxin domain-containing protein [Geobacteraceae bacterium]